MSRWFRHYAGMCRDDKLVSVAIRSKQPIERVVWIWAAILESAAEIDDGGRFSVDEAEIAYFLRADEADVHSVFVGLCNSGRILEDRVAKWSDRQFQSDRSAERQRRYRERHRDGGEQEPNPDRDDEVTSPKRQRDAPETETETETETEKKETPTGLSPAVEDRRPSDPPRLALVETIKPPVAKPCAKPSDDGIVDFVSDLWNHLAGQCGLAKCRAITDKRAAHVRARARDLVDVFDFANARDGFRDAMIRIRGSPFLLGQGQGRPWKCDFDFFVSESGFLKIMEGKYAAPAKPDARFDNLRRN